MASRTDTIVQPQKGKGSYMTRANDDDRYMIIVIYNLYHVDHFLWLCDFFSSRVW